METLELCTDVVGDSSMHYTAPCITFSVDIQHTISGFGKNVPEQWEQPVLPVYFPPYRSSSRAGGII